MGECKHGQPDWTVCQDCIDDVSQNQADRIKELETMSRDLAYAEQEAQKRIGTLEERLSWAIQLSDDHNCGPSGTWSDRFNAEIDAAILEAQESGT
jgi:hypothetical protein